MNYNEFLHSKIEVAPVSGFEVRPEDINPASIHPDVWDDISRMKTLNTAQSQRRKQLHVCPLPLDIVERVFNWWMEYDVLPGQIDLFDDAEVEEWQN